MDEDEPVDCEFSCGGEDPAFTEMTKLMDVPRDGNRTGASDILANSMAPVDNEAQREATIVTVGRTLGDFVDVIDSEIGGNSDASALSGFVAALRRASGLSVEDSVDEMAASVASNDIGTVGRLLGPRDVNAIKFGENEFPRSVVRRLLKCSLLDVAVGSGSVEMTKYLLEFRGAKATRETL
jgi:hypothetical protein